MIVLLLLALMVFGIYLMISSKGIFQKFGELGDMSGKTYSEIVSIVGKPSSISWYSEVIVAQWQEGDIFTGLDTITLRFTREQVFLGVISQHRM
jgi:hypothetical protein